MEIVNFAIPKVLEQRVKHVMREKGFSSKAEFFRFAAIHFIDVVSKPIANDDQQTEYLTGELAKEIRRAYRGRPIQSIQHQLSDV